MYAKLRRLGYFVPECEEVYKRLVFDQLNIYEGMYDFTTFQVENPIIEEVDTPSLEPVVDDSEPRIYEVQQAEEAKEVSEVVVVPGGEVEVEETTESKQLERTKRFKLFKIDYSKVNVPELDYTTFNVLEF
jgi:hypothetical protein